MATDYDPDYAYTLDTTLSAEDHFGNLYDFSDRSKGLYSTLNGNLSIDGNIDSTVLAGAYQVIPGAHVLPFTELSNDILTLYDETIKSTNDYDDNWVAFGSRVHTPHKYDVCLVQWHLALMPFRVQLFEDASVADWELVADTDVSAYVSVWLNGTEITGARIELPMTVHADTAGDYYTLYTNSRAQLHYGSWVAAADHGSIRNVAGLNKLEFKVMLRQPGDDYELSTLVNLGLTGAVNYDIEYRTRCTIGNASITWMFVGGQRA